MCHCSDFTVATGAQAHRRRGVQAPNIRRSMRCQRTGLVPSPPRCHTGPLAKARLGVQDGAVVTLPCGWEGDGG